MLRSRDVPVCLGMVRDERIELILHEARTVIARKSRRRQRSGHDKEDRGEARYFHDSPHS